MMSSRYAAEPEEPEPQTPKRAKRQSVDSKPLPSLPQSPADANSASHRPNDSSSSMPATSPRKDRTGLDASSPKASAPSSPAVRRVKNTSTERFDWSDDDPKTPFKPDEVDPLKAFSPSKRAPEASAQSSPLKSPPMNPNAAVFTSPRASPTKPVPEAARPAQLQAMSREARVTSPAEAESAEKKSSTQAAAVLPSKQDAISRPESRLAPPPASVPGLAPTPDIVSRLDTMTPTARGGARKIVSKNGKPCIIRIPPGAVHVRPGWKPWTPAEAKARIDDFEKQGWDTRGFSQASSAAAAEDSTHGDHAQARPMSSEAGLFVESKKSQVKAAIVFPDQAKWTNYMNMMIEAKLKGLGVIKAPTPPPEPSPMEQPNPLSRAASTQYPGLAASPPLPTSSAASQHMWGMPFSPEFSQGAASTVNTSLGALASPALSMGNQQQQQQGLKMGQNANANQNGFNLNYNASANGFVPQAWAGQHMLNSQDFARGGSPAFGFAGVQRIGSAFQQQQQQESPDVFGGQQTPRPFENGPSPFAPSIESSGNMSSNNMSRSNTLLSQRPATPEQTRDSVEDAERTPGARQESDYPELAYPTPRGHSHRHNISANLEREVENPQYYPGEFVHGGAPAEQRGGPADFKFGGSSSSGITGRANGHQPGLSTASTSSASRLNVNAKEFKFDPAAAHGRQFSMSKNALLPTTHAQPQVSMVTAHANRGSTSSSFNAGAPSFKPPEQSKFSFASVGFNFNSAKDSLEKNKLEDGRSPTEEADSKTTTPAGPKIFNHIEATDIVIPSKKSKAITIVNPALSKPATSKSNSDNEDESGRAGPEKGRTKRNKLGGADGDDVPQFATPTPEPEAMPAAFVLPSNANADAKDIFGPRSNPQATPEDAAAADGKLVDVSDNDWHEPDVSTAWHEPDRRSERVSRPKQQDASTARPKREPRPVRSTYVPPHKRQSLPYPDDVENDNERAIKGNGMATPTFDQIDNVMDALNDDNSDFGIEESLGARGRSPAKLVAAREPKRATASPLAPLNPNRLAQLGSQQPTLSPRGMSSDWVRDQAARSSESPVRKINSVKEPQVSDWDDLLPASDELPQAQFFDTRVRDLIEGALGAQIAPLTTQLRDMRALVTRMSRDQHETRLLSSHEKSSSDADDEDDDAAVTPAPRPASRAASRRADRMAEHVRTAVAEAMRNAQIGSSSSETLEREIALRHDAERRADDLKRAHDLSEQEIMLYKESAENSSLKIQGLRDTQKLSEERTLELEQEIEALQGTLDEYRSSSKKWRQEIDNAKNAREVLTATIEKMRGESEAERSARDETAQNLQQMQEALAEASTNLATERGAWQGRIEEQIKHNAVLETKLQEALQRQTRQEEEIERLGLQEKLAIKSGMALEEARSANSKMEVDIAKLRADLDEHHSHASRFETDALDAQSSAKTEAQRVQTLMDAEVEAANRRAENSRADLEARIDILRAELEAAAANSETAKQEHTRLLDESFTARKQALEDAHHTAMSKLADQQARFERQLQDVDEQHRRELDNAREDQQRSESHLGDDVRLAQDQRRLAEDKLAHYLDKIKHLEDKVQVAQAAAEAAATAAARSAGPKSPVAAPAAAPTPAPVPAPIPAPATAPLLAPDEPLPHAVTERVSPQALRESIDVLQDQLQDRETQIERLEQEIAEVDKEAPSKLQVAETEIGWLREVLSVRVDDLTDLVNNLTMEKFDRGAARNAAIRIRANIEMEKQEKERIARGEARSVPLPSLSDLQNFATPRAAQLAAAWGNWRRGGQSPMASVRGALAGPSGVDETPSKKPSPAPQVPKDMSSAQSFLSGLMTPPASNVRRTPSTGPSSQRPLQSAVAEPKLSYPFPQPRDAEASPTRSGSEQRDEAPSTPRLLRQGSYDEDAADARSINYPNSDAEESPRKGGPLSMEQELADYADDDGDAELLLPTGQDEVAQPEPVAASNPLGKSQWSS